MNSDEIFNLFINDVAGKKEVEIEEYTYNVALNYDITDNNYKVQTCIVEDNLPILNINNGYVFKDKLDKYIKILSNKSNILESMPFSSEKDRIKYMQTMLFVNATCEDFEFPLKYIDMYTSAIEDDTFEDLKEGKSICKLNSFKDSTLKVKSSEQSIFLESPQRLEFSLSKLMQDNNEYTISLPSVSCFCYQDGKNKVLNIGAIQNKKIDSNKEKNIFEKQVNREKFKLNSGVEKEEQDVEPLAILSLATTIFLAKEKGVNKIRMPDFMPMRWYAKSLANEKKSKYKNLDLEKLQSEQMKIQTNITNKFLRNMIRVNEQIGIVDINLFPGELGDYLECNITDKQVENPNKILKEIADNICMLKSKEDGFIR